MFPALSVAKTDGQRVKDVMDVKFGDKLVVQIQEQAKAIALPLQAVGEALALRDVFGERHHELRHALGAWNEGNVVAYPDQAGIFASILLLNLKLTSLPFAQ